MNNITSEEKIGARVSLTILLSAILLIVLTMMVISGGVMHLVYFPFDYSFLVLLFSTIFWGSRAGTQIIIRNKNDDWIGIKTAFLILLTFIISRIPLDMDFENVFNDVRSLRNFFGGLLSTIGALTFPTIIYGILIGRRIKKCAP